MLEVLGSLFGLALVIPAISFFDIFWWIRR